MSTVLARPAPAVRRAEADGDVLPLRPVRAAVLLVLAAFAALHWMQLVEPAAPRRAWLAVAIAALVVLGLCAAARLERALRWTAAGVVALIACVLALLAGGLADEYLRPDQWGALAGGASRGIEALPGVRVPYRGLDEWTRLVIGAGGTLLVVLAALLAFWPRRGRTGFPALALGVLVAVYAIPAVVLVFEREFLRGAALAVLVLAFLRLETLRVREAPAAAAAVAAAAVLALVAAPALDGRDPWWDYESWAVETAGTRSVAFAWDHDYSPLDWPRDGRELLRVKARFPAYWKARDLDVYDGRTWRQDPRQRSEAVGAQLPDDTLSVSRWSQQIRVSLRNLRSDTFVTAGITTGVGGEPAVPIGGGVFSAPGGLKRGDTYTAEVYTPRPTDRQLRTAGAGYEDWLRFYRSIVLLGYAAGAAGRDAATFVTWPAWGQPGGPEAARFDEPVSRGGALVRGDPGLARIWALSKRLKQGAATPFEYMQRVEAYLEEGFSYSEAPPASAGTLDGFLFDAKIGFCQQYSGAEALLLRMAGIPARVATGFSAGSYDDEQKEYVVRDFDAHSWVEAWFPGFGWVTRDPTPAAAPPRSQPGDGRTGALAGRGAPTPGLGGENATDPLRARATPDGGTNWGLLSVAALAAVALAAGAVLLERRRRRRLPPPALRPMAEFERALRRARFDGGPGLTLSGLERAFSGWPGAAGYVRALREQRYSGRAVVPTPEQRRGLRAALARDAGVLRSWWALPPRGPGRG